MSPSELDEIVEFYRTLEQEGRQDVGETDTPKGIVSRYTCRECGDRLAVSASPATGTTIIEMVVYPCRTCLDKRDEQSQADAWKSMQHLAAREAIREYEIVMVKTPQGQVFGVHDDFGPGPQEGDADATSPVPDGDGADRGDRHGSGEPGTPVRVLPADPGNDGQPVRPDVLVD